MENYKFNHRGNFSNQTSVYPNLLFRPLGKRQVSFSTCSVKKIPLKYAFYIVGFTDGQGSWNISFKKRDDYLTGWKITAAFNISQKEKLPLTFIKKHLSCGTIRSRQDGVWAYEVTSINSFMTRIIPFFDTFPSVSVLKKTAFQNFKNIVLLLHKNKGLFLKHELDLLISLRNLGSPGTQSRRTYSDEFILQRYAQFWDTNSKKILEIKSSPSGKAHG